MAEERNAHVKLAMAEVLGLYMIALIGILVGCYGLKVFDGLGVIIAVSMYLGLGLLVCTFIAFYNENLLLTGIFGVLAVFLLGFGEMVGGAMGAFGDFKSAMIYMIFIGVLLLIMALVSWFQPVKILPILLAVAGIAFIMLGMWFNDFGAGKGEDLRQVVGILWLLVGVLATYMAAMITLLVMGKPVAKALLVK